MPSNESLKTPLPKEPVYWTDADVEAMVRHLLPAEEQKMLQEMRAIEMRYHALNRQRLLMKRASAWREQEEARQA